MLQLCKLSNTGSKPNCLVLRTIFKHDPTSHLETAHASDSVIYSDIVRVISLRIIIIIIKLKKPIRPNWLRVMAPSIFGLVSPWSSTSWPPTVDHFMPLPHGTLPIGIKIGSFVFKISCSQDGNRRTNKYKDGQTNEWIGWEHYASTCQCPVVA